MDLNIDDELVVKYYDLEEERRKIDEAVLEAKLKRLEPKIREKIYKEVMEKGIEQGIQQGALETKKEMVINMYNKNLELKDISEFTGLNSVEVENIINENLKSNNHIE